MTNITKVMPLGLFLLLWWSIAKAEEILKSCKSEFLLDCPKFAQCIKLNANDDLKCICLEGFQLNPNWQIYENLNDTSLIPLEHYCLPLNYTTQKKEDNKLILYLRSPARKEHLVFGILLVLLAAALATAVLYGLKVLNPLKRSKAVYKKLKERRRNITPLQELDELELNRRYEI